MAFDVEGARKAGYTDAEIAAHLAARTSFDLAGAKRAGYTDSEVIAHLSKKAQIPRDPSLQGPAPTAPAPSVDPSLMDRAIGAGEAALTIGTGATGGALGMIGGTLKGLAEQILSGQFGTPQAANLVEQSAAQGAQALTYAPRTPEGQEMAAAVGGVMQNLIPLTPLTAEVSAVGRAVGSARQSVAPVIAARIEGALSRPAETGIPSGGTGTAKTLLASLSDGNWAKARSAEGAADLVQTAKKAADSSEPASQALAAAAAPDPTTVAAAERLGIRDYLQPDHLTTNQAFREFAQAVKSIPGSEARAAELQGLERVAERAVRIVDDLGGADISMVSEGVRQRQLGRIAELGKMEEMLYNKVRAGLPPRTPAPAQRALDLVRSRADDLGGAENLSPMERDILRRLSPGEDGRQPTYALLDDVRKDVGAVTSRGGPFADADVGLAKKYYGLLAEDQRAAAEAAGQRWNYLAAQYATRLRKGVEEDMTSLFGREIDRSLSTPLAGAMSALPKGEASKLLKILDATPASMRQEVVASGLLTAFRTAQTRGPISFARYEKWYEGLLRNRQAHLAVMSNLPAESRKQLSDLYRVSRGINAASRERITTGRIRAAQDQFSDSDTLAGRFVDAAHRSAAGAVVGTVLSPVVGPGVAGALASALTRGPKSEAIRAVDKLLVSPEFERLVRASNPAQQRVAVRSLAASQHMRRFVHALGESTMTQADREAWITQALTPAAQTQAVQQRREEAPATLLVQ